MLALTSFASAADEEEDKTHYVNPKEWTSLLNDNDNLLVMFISDRLTDCHSCVAAKDALKTIYTDRPERFLAKYVVFECKRAQKLCAKYEITEYPTVRLYSEGVGIYDFEFLSFEAKFIADWMRIYTAPKSKEITDAVELKQTIDDEKCSVVLFYQEGEDDKVLASFKRTAAKYHRKQPAQKFYHFVVTADNVDALQEYDADPGDIILFKHVGGLQQYKFTEKVSRKRLSGFVDRNVPWPVYEIIASDWSEAMRYKLPTIVAYINYKKEDVKRDVVGALDKAARAFKSSIVFAFKNGGEQGDSWYEKWHFDGKNRPDAAIMLYDNLNRAKYQFPVDQEITAESVRDFCDDFVQGKLARFVFKEPVPEADANSLITKLVVDNYREIVHDSTKDVIVYFYLPNTHCPPCESMTKPFEEFAKKIKESGRDDIVVAHMDLQKNEHTFGVRVTTFPTIAMFQKDDKFMEVYYPGARDAGILYSWARENATDWEAEEEEEELVATDGEVSE